MQVKHDIAWATAIGSAHAVNQDAVGAWTWTRGEGEHASLLVVADGVSAGDRSEEASRAAVDALHSRLEPMLRDPTDRLGSIREALLGTAREVSGVISRRPRVSPDRADATTLVAVACIGGTGVGIWCGDSRVYQVTHAGAVALLTRDHSWAEGVVSSGLMSRVEAASDPRARMITRWLGSPEQHDPGVEIFRFDLHPGDAILCCSDGVSMYFSTPHGSQQELSTVFAAGQELSESVQRLMATAAERGGRDDMSVAALRLRDG
jgi:serine/threonine protein phosphatase PrpC